MIEDAHGRHRKRRGLWLALAVLVVVLAVILVPPLVSLSRYKSQITHLISASLGRQVSLSSVEVRLLPWPGFVLTDLTLQEDPAFGAEPVLHANTVRASIRLLSLWRGRLEISRISMDEASLNLVRTSGGRWNMDSLFRSAAQSHAGTVYSRPNRVVPLPYLEATNSRINFKRGREKLPFSLVNTDLSVWQEDAGDWGIRLRGQPARTDVSLDLADTGVARLEARVHPAPELRQMPVHLDIEWREAQFGQLTQLVLGSDPGWRGDLTGELHADGTADLAQIKTRLRATGVHRAEFSPAAPLDFDANCGFVYHFSARALDGMVCDSPLGDGRIRVAGAEPGAGAASHFSVELDRIPVAAGLDAWRTVRSGLGPGLEVQGTISGKMNYAEEAQESSAGAKLNGSVPARKSKRGRAVSSSAPSAPQGPLTGSFSVDGLQLRGDGFHTPIEIPRVVVEVAPPPPPGQRLPGPQANALAATISIPAGGGGPLTLTTRLSLSGYEVTVRGPAALARAKELAHAAGLASAGALDSLAGDAVTVDLNAEGPWMAVERDPLDTASPASIKTEAATSPGEDTASDHLSGTVMLHNANWKPDFLANHVEISQATLHIENGRTRWDPVNFSYGPVKGMASLDLPGDCGALQSCQPHFQVQFGALDAAVLQAAILGAHERGTLLSSLIARLSPSNPSAASAWPLVEGTVKADLLILGPITLKDPSARLRVLSDGAEITNLDAGVLGGRIHGGGTLKMPEKDQAKPFYTLEAKVEKLNPPAVGQLVGLHWSGGAFDANGKIELSGFTEKELTTSAKGMLHFDWHHGAVGAQTSASTLKGAFPKEIARFDLWTADAAIANGTITLNGNQILQGNRKRSVEAAITLGDKPAVSIAESKGTQVKR